MSLVCFLNGRKSQKSVFMLSAEGFAACSEEQEM